MDRCPSPSDDGIFSRLALRGAHNGTSYINVHSDFWHDRWRTAQIGFHRTAADDNLIRHWRDLSLPKAAPQHASEPTRPKTTLMAGTNIALCKCYQQPAICRCPN